MKHWLSFLFGAIFIIVMCTPLRTAAVDIEAQKALEAELYKIEAQITELEGQLKTTTGQKNTLARKIQQLKQEQAKLRLQIQATKLQLQDLEKKLDTTKKAIDDNEVRARELKKQLSTLLRVLYQKNQVPLVLQLASANGLSAVATELQESSDISESIHGLLDEVEILRKKLGEEQAAYAVHADGVRELLTVTTIQQTALSGKLNEQSTLLKETQGKEATYQQLLADNKKRAAEIKSRIYELLGVGTQINFGQAVSIASWVEGQTNVPAAFLLAILTQESNLGKNVGTCNRLGDPPEKSWRVVMKPNRDQEPFLEITKALEKNPDITPVSCPMKNKDGSQLGWGGAMGPAQFIPSTWVRYDDKVVVLTGKDSADPWDIRDAFVAAALLLRDNGANTTRDGQWKAAMRYFSGSTNPKYRFYGDNVLSLTDKYKQDIKDLEE